MTTPRIEIRDGEIEVGEYPEIPQRSPWGLTPEDLAEIEALPDEPAGFGGPGSGPRPGHQSPWYERGSRKPGFVGYTPKVMRGPTGALSGQPYRYWASDFGHVAEIRTAAEVLLSQEPLEANREVAGADMEVIDTLASGDLSRDTPATVESRKVADMANTLLTAVQRAKPAHAKLYRGLSFDDMELAEFRAAHGTGAEFDISLASTTGNEDIARTFADNAARRDGSTEPVLMEIAGGSLSFEAPNNAMEEFVTSGRFKVTGWGERDGFDVMQVEQLGVFDTANGGYLPHTLDALVASFGTPRAFVHDPFWEVFGPAPDDDVEATFGGPGSGPKPGHRSPWYERGRKGVAIPTHAVAPDGSPADNGRFGRAFETIMLNRIAPEIALDLDVDGIQRISSNDGGSTTTPIDIVLGDPADRGNHYAGEVKTQHTGKTEYKVSISSAAKKRKLAAARETGAVPITVLQVIDQDAGKAYVHVMTDQFKSFRAGKPGGTSNRQPDYVYEFTDDEYADAYEQAGPADG